MAKVAIGFKAPRTAMVTESIKEVAADYFFEDDAISGDEAAGQTLLLMDVGK